MGFMEEYYKNNIEHIYDELYLADLIIYSEVLRFRSQNDVQESELRGLYISESEIDELLKGSYSGEARGPLDLEINGNYLDEYNKAKVAIENLSGHITKKIDSSLRMGVRLNLLELSSYYELSTHELEILSICLVHQINTKYSKLFSYLQNDVTKKNPTVELLLNLTCSNFEEKIYARDFFSPQSPLFKNHLLEFVDRHNDQQKPLLLREVRMNNRITGFLLDSQYVDDMLKNISRIYKPRVSFTELVLPEKITNQFTNFISYFKSSSENVERNFVFSFYGNYGIQKEEVAAAICKEIDLPMMVVDLAALYHSQIPFEHGVDMAMRESNILPAGIFFKNGDAIFNNRPEDAYMREYLVKLLDEHSWLSFVDTVEQLGVQGKFNSQKFVEVELLIPDYKGRKELWDRYLKDIAYDEEINVKELSGKYNLTGGQIKEAVSTASTFALWRSPDDVKITGEDLIDACHLHSNQRLNDLAKRIKPRYTWNDIILPQEKISLLKEISSMVKYKHVVYEEWGFGGKLALGKGISALFHGEPGTGKTMACDIIAKELEMDLYKIDISTIISKYIGETEKNLNKIFTEAESSNAILFFDEADSIFGKRTEVKDSHDRYSNIEVSYLLQKIDEYNGIVVMATNYAQNIDEAFERRLHFSINFPFPDEESRLRIWKNIFPKAMPLGDDVDLELLAKKMEIAGGNIKNIALCAAFYAAENDKMVRMEHVTRACKREYDKMGRLWSNVALK